MSEEEEQIYCICRSSDVSRFMIGCDHCEEWYHGDCINVTAKESKYIKKFYCKECTDKNSDLKIVYKSKYMGKVLKMQEENESKQKKEKKKEKKKHKERDKERSRSRERHKHKDKKHKKDKSREKDEKRKEEKLEKEVKKENDEKKSRKIISDSDEDEEPQVVVDVVKKEKEEKHKLDLERKIKEEKEAKHRERQREKEIERERQKLREEKRKEKELEDKIKKEHKEKKEKVEKIKQESHDTPTRKPLQAKDIQNISKYESAEEWKPEAAPPQPQPPPQKRKAGKEGGPNKRKRAWRPEYDTSEDEDGGVDLAPRQCYGMECVNCARVGSKYCSDQCGLNVATIRICHTLPDRIREWNMTPCQAEQKNRKELERIREDIQKAKQRLEEVNREAELLEEVIAKGKTMSIIENKSDDSSEDEDESKGTGVVNCITCGKDVTARTAIRHMESCFNKFESQTSFGSMYKTRIEGYQMFCDFYNSSTGTYCKRLRVICPEHTKDQKVSDTEVCGYPLTKDLFKSTGEFCRLPRKVCHDHFSWEKLKRAELDMDRVRQWLKLDELLEKERHEKESMSRRAGVLNLLLHSTYNHEIAAIMQQKKARAQAAGHQQTAGHQQMVRGSGSGQSVDKSRKSGSNLAGR